MTLETALCLLAFIVFFLVSFWVTDYFTYVRKHPKYKVTGNGVISQKASDIPRELICEPDKNNLDDFLVEKVEGEPGAYSVTITRPDGEVIKGRILAMNTKVIDA